MDPSLRKTCAAPAALARRALAGVEQVPITIAPLRVQIWVSNNPSPPAQAGMRIYCPFFTSCASCVRVTAVPKHVRNLNSNGEAGRKRRNTPVNPCSNPVAASLTPIPAGTLAVRVALERQNSAKPPPAEYETTSSPTAKVSTELPTATTVPEDSFPRMNGILRGYSPER